MAPCHRARSGKKCRLSSSAALDKAMWAVELFTENGGKLRAKDKAKWKKGLELSAADAYLTELFDELG